MKPMTVNWKLGSELPPRWRLGPESEVVLAIAETDDGALQMTPARVVSMSKGEWRVVRFNHNGLGRKIVVRCWTAMPPWPRKVPELKNGEHDGMDIMHARSAIDELRELRAWRDKAFQAHPNLDRDIEALGGEA